ncbi:uncharacterized protein LOC133332219 [Musca vetustissima]|uniref:uncharacterized protein LOC133332219 n=1 Tax=Musca vetustissima TaxID=27455 RepID=UPI002AB76AB2|nr:uncharacterized protein LOC133332219 [Musca vetustissima]
MPLPSPRTVQTDPNILRKLHLAHTKSIANAQSLIDVKPTKMLATTFLNMNKLKDDFKASKRILKDNIQLLKRINYIQRNHGKTECYNKYQGQKRAYLENVNRQRERIQKENFELGCRLLKITSTMDTHERVKQSKDLIEREEKQPSPPLDEAMLSAYMEVALVKEREMMEQLLRPKIYLDLGVKNIRHLGRFVIQLYTEACPDLVLQFVRLCTHNMCDQIQFIRIFPLLWLELELAVENEILIIYKDSHGVC